MIIKENVSFKDLSTFKVGGAAQRVLYPEAKEEVREAILSIREGDDPLLILGGGSNVVAPNEDFLGTAIIPSLNNIYIEKERVTVGAGVVWDVFVEEMIQNRLWGVENLSGIPGTVGGAVFQNIGAYGAALSQTLKSVYAYDIDTDSFVTFKNSECNFSYRTSVFKEERGRYVILEATFALSKTPTPNISYKDLAQYFERISTPGLKEIREAVVSIRNEKFPDLSLYGTAGSFFLNPVIREEEADTFQKKYPNMPLFNMPEGGIKVPLAWLLDYKNGVMDIRNMKVGGAFMWERQPLVIATNEHATANDIQQLSQKIKDKVKKEIHLEINFEVVFL